ncbi:BtrH N-terminal domain-containing protein [Ferriphaselus sp. R-1]|uniref:BtrH N-terminal domain-containing protein n=1 Tax=Ferriphaselus sp. R-1 TaxID=1485544 RepID=UPI000555D4C1|nr:BtrH N-terminal domain-containing protein [Ferriphaselus sp. R-1]
MTAAQSAFQHRHAAHCESGVAANLMTHHGIALSEAMAFGLSSALSFAYLPFVKLTGFPLIAYRMPPKSILKGVSKELKTRFHFETFGDPAQGMRRLDELLAQGRVVGLQTSVFWLPYFPEDMRFHFNAHNLLVYGKDGDDYLISDPVAELPQRCASADLQRARFAKGALAPKGLLYYPEHIGSREIGADAIRRAIVKTVRIMLGPIPIVGVRGINMLANKVARLDTSEHSLNYVGHIVRMQEEIGTGGAGFRFLYAAFLQEAASITGIAELERLSERLNEIGDGWREFALKAARMIKGRERFDPPLLAGMLRTQAGREKEFFQALKRAVA